MSNIPTTTARAEPSASRPLSARSLIASLLLGMERPERPAADLVRWCGLFGVSGGAARVALSRMVDAGELRAERGRYELIGRVRARAAEHDVARGQFRRPWNGQWIVAVVTADSRSSDDRVALRRELRRARYAEQREGVWTRPDNLAVAGLVQRDAQCRIWRAEPDGDAAELAEALFGLAAWDERATALCDRLSDAADALRSVDGRDAALADSFVAAASALVHLRADPLVPAALLPTTWAGDALRRTYDDYQPMVDRAIAAWFRAGRAA